MKNLICFFIVLGLGTIHTTAQSITEISNLLSPHIADINKGVLKTVQLQRMAGELERIALAHPSNWHAQYYTALAYTELANNAPKKDIDNLCDRAQEFLDKAIQIKPQESENHVLKAYLLSARINVNAMFRGASMGKESKTELDTALQLNPNNPRAHYVRAMGIYFTPAAFGGGKKKAKPHLEMSLEKYGSFSAQSSLDPSWGLNEVKKLLATY